MRTPENKFVVEFLVEGTEYAAIRGIVDDLYAADPFQASRLLSAIRWEAPTELEETALRWRTGRLADLGFPPLEEALSWFARPPRASGAEAAHAPGAPARPAGFFLATLARDSLLDRAAAALAPEDREAVEQQLVAAGNAVLVADAVDVADLEAVRDAFGAARTYLELGLEKLAGQDVARAADVLAATPVKRLFQEGFGRILELAWRAERLFKDGKVGTRAAPFLDAPLGEALAAVAARRPRYFPGLDAPREDWGGPAAAAFQPRRFGAAAELSRTAEALALCEGLAALAGRLGLGPVGDGPLAPRLSAVYLTALARERLGLGFEAEPIPAAELPRVAAALARIEDPRLDGPAGALLLELARARAGELRAADGAGPARPEHVSAVWVRD
jgi:hypothetical protein